MAAVSVKKVYYFTFFLKVKRASGVDEQLCQVVSRLAPLNHPNCIPYHPSDQLENVNGFNTINIITLATGTAH